MKTREGQVRGVLVLRKTGLFLSGLLLLASCSAAERGPVIPFFGAYFPSWIACSLIGIFGAVIIRLFFIKAGIDAVMPLRVVVYLFLAIAIGLASSILLFGR